ncbi:MAG: FkbM family methyltransferase, partial [Nitrososphaera sp.]|nr:FkbM family methyltransferase [Nitrososphaera sp.]
MKPLIHKSKDIVKSALKFLHMDGAVKRIRSGYNKHKIGKYRLVDRFKVTVDDITVSFSTEDEYSKGWFLPRYEGGKIHERQVTELVLETTKNSRCFVDVGTNLGWYTCLTSRSMVDGVVYAFEMDDLNYALLRKNLEINSCHNVKAYNVAVSNVTGTAKYVRASMHPSAVFRLMDANKDSACANVVSVKAIALDDFFSNTEIMPDVIKIDVEGAEGSVLKGMQTILHKGHATLFVELH